MRVRLARGKEGRRDAGVEPFELRLLFADRFVGDADRDDLPVSGEGRSRLESQRELGPAEGVGPAGVHRAAVDGRTVGVDSRRQVDRDDVEAEAFQLFDDLASQAARAAHDSGAEHRVDDERRPVEQAPRPAPGRGVRSLDDRDFRFPRGLEVGRGIALEPIGRAEEDDVNVDTATDQVACDDEAVAAVVALAAQNDSPRRPVFSSQANFISVVAGVFWGMAIFGEEPSLWIWASLVLLVAALLLALPRRDSGC